MQKLRDSNKSDVEQVMNGDGWNNYVWGEVQNIHRIGCYGVIEYLSNFRDEKGTRYFHPVIWTDQYKQYHNDEFYWEDTNTSDHSLEAAICGAIGRKFDGLNSQAAGYFCKMIGLE